MGRRGFLQRAATALAAPWIFRGPGARAGAATGPYFSVRRELFLPAQPGVTVLATSRYMRRDGLELCSRHSHMTRSDTSDRVFVRASSDNGRNWSEPQEVTTVEKRGAATFRRSATGSIVDPKTGALVKFGNQGLFTDDSPLGRLRGYAIRYGVSPDGGRTWTVDEPVIQHGAEFSADHPLPGVWRGKNCAYIGDTTCTPIALADGTLLQPIQLVPMGDDGKFYNPAGGYTYTHAAVLRGRWKTAGRLEWEMSSVVMGDPARSTRGMIEPTVAELRGGRLLMVLRGSNEKKPEVAGGRWVAFSADAGKTWSAPRYWTYNDGERFYSPSACSQLLAHSSGKLFWVGNITPTNPAGNRPRYPLVLGEVDSGSGLLRRETVTTIDDRGPGDGELLALSNFFAREDRETGEVVLHLTRQGVKSTARKPDFTAEAYLYRITVG